MGTIGFWSQCIILLGDHFTGARSYFLPVYHFTETSFYRNNFVKVSVSFLSVPFYSSTLKFCNAMYHFTGSLWLHKTSTFCIILRVDFGRKQSNVSFYRFNFEKFCVSFFNVSFYWVIILLVHF